MQVIDWIMSHGPWAWIVAGLIFLGLELVVPGGYLLWLGIAGIITGLAALFQPIGLPLQWGLFGILSLVAILGWMRLSRNRADDSDRPLLNQRAARLVGLEAVLAEPISAGSGRLLLSESVWRITGPDLAAGQRVRIVGHEGNVLKVEPVGP